MEHWDAVRQRLWVIGLALAVVVLLVALLLLGLAAAAHWIEDPEMLVRIAGLIASVGVGFSLVYFAWAQLSHAKTMRVLSMAPVLSAKFLSNSRELLISNAGNGTAMDIRACVCRMGATMHDDLQYYFPTTVSASHLGPSEDANMAVSPYEGGDPPGFPRQAGPWPTLDVYIIHYADLNGEHWHTWCNWNRNNTPDKLCRHVFIVERRERTPTWIRSNCQRCGEMEGGRGGRLRHLLRYLRGWRRRSND